MKVNLMLDNVGAINISLNLTIYIMMDFIMRKWI